MSSVVAALTCSTAKPAIAPKFLRLGWTAPCVHYSLMGHNIGVVALVDEFSPDLSLKRRMRLCSSNRQHLR